MRAPVRRALLALAVVAVALGAATAAVVTVGRVQHQVGPLQVSLWLVPAPAGGTQVHVPPLGNLRLDTHDGPLALRARVDGVDPTQVRSVLPVPERAQLVASVTGDVRSGVRELALRSGVAAVLAAALATAVVFRRRGAVLLGVTATVVVGAAAAGVATSTLRPEAVGRPTFDGLLAQAPAVLGMVDGATAALDAYGARVTELADGVAALYGALRVAPPSPGADTVRLLHVSDVHNNAAAYRVMDVLVQQFDVAAVVDTGDSTDLGSSLENQLHSAAGGLGVPYLWVRGNHDSAATQQFLRQVPGVQVLDGDVVQVAGLRIAGIGDPRYTPVKRRDPAGPGDRPVLRAAGQRLADLVASQPEPVDVALVHEPGMAGPLHGVVPLVLDGHVHERRERRVGGTLELTQGSSGGAGLRALDTGTPLPLSMSVLHLNPVDGSLVAVDEVDVAGIGPPAAAVQRRAADEIAADDAAADNRRAAVVGAPDAPPAPHRGQAPAERSTGPAYLPASPSPR